jgi:hypothetical protein
MQDRDEHRTCLAKEGSTNQAILYGRWDSPQIMLSQNRRNPNR